jgi:hypothetical protein
MRCSDEPAPAPVPPLTRKKLVEVALRDLGDVLRMIDTPQTRLDRVSAMAICDFLRALVQADPDPSVSEFICSHDARAFRGLTGLLQSHDDDPAVIQSACKLAAALVQRVGGTYLQDWVGRMSLLADILREHVSDADTARSLSELLAVLSAKAVSVIFQRIKRDGADEEPSDVISRSSPLAADLANNVGSLLRALEVNADDGSISLRLCDVLRALATTSALGASNIVGLGGVPLLIGAFVTHGADGRADVARIVCEALSALQNAAAVSDPLATAFATLDWGDAERCDRMMAVLRTIEANTIASQPFATAPPTDAPAQITPALAQAAMRFLQKRLTSRA